MKHDSLETIWPSLCIELKIYLLLLSEIKPKISEESESDLFWDSLHFHHAWPFKRAVKRFPYFMSRPSLGMCLLWPHRISVCILIFLSLL